MSTASSGSDTSQVATTIRYEPGLLVSQGSQGGIEDRFKTMSDFYLLAFHQDKMMNAAKHANWSAQLIKLYSGDRGLQLLFARLLLHVHEECRADGPLQLRLTWSRDGKFDISSSSALRPGLLFPFNLFDKAEPSVEAFGTLFKKASIQVLVDGRDPPASESARSSASSRSNFECASPNHERLIVSQYGEITQGEFTTPYFQRDGVWITPAFSGVAADCVTRRYALEQGLCKEGIVPKSSLKEGDQCWLSDGVRGFCRGTIRFSPVDHENDRAFDTPKTHHRTTKDDMKMQSMNESELALTEIDQEGEKEEDKNEVTIIQATEPDRKHRSHERANPFAASSSPTTRRSQRGRPDFIPSYLADEDEVYARSGSSKAVPNPEHRGVIHRRRPPRPYFYSSSS